MGVEREAKLQVPPGFRLPELGGDGRVVTVHEPSRIVSTYFDTEDLDLVRWGCSLRDRPGEGWTVKLPSERDGDLLVRPELVFDAPSGARRPPEPAVELLRAYVRDRRLAPVARLRTMRQAVEIADELGRPVAVVTDDEVSLMDGRRVATRFREVEIELAPGVSADRLDPIVDVLRAAGAGPVDNVSKLRRSLGPRSEEPPEVVIADVERGASVADVVRRAFASSVVRLIRHDAGVRLGEDPEDVHQARVATRRMRSDLRLFRDVLEPTWTRSLRDELGWLGDRLGAVRDAEVLHDRLRERAAILGSSDRSEADALLAGLERRRDAARQELLAGMREPRYTDLLDRLVWGAADPSFLDGAGTAAAADALPALLEGPWKHLETSIEHVASDPSDEALHAARIRAKRARYAAEAVAPVFGKTARRFAEAAADLQDVLGEHQDAVVAGAWLHEARSSEQAFVAGELAALEAEAAAAARAAWPAAWKALSRKRLRFWT
ncbi:MAG TPA: CYTH and CHAD domain-containing protein [Actinomycetota bacterium]|nr:CYTH and CHAD domain-containing protein [Actinomycetota bacterium]